MLLVLRNNNSYGLVMLRIQLIKLYVFGRTRVRHGTNSHIRYSFAFGRTQLGSYSLPISGNILTTCTCTSVEYAFCPENYNYSLRSHVFYICHLITFVSYSSCSCSSVTVLLLICILINSEFFFLSLSLQL